ncbi:MAG TPA: hypothetical protein VLT57_06060 [Bryobacteraceae bacterium]|nr:hypothetical protein [Bryobacteraceae bacterium]
MMKWILLMALASASLSAADLSGVWSADVDLDAGSGTATFEFKQAGNTLTGSYSGQLGDAKITGAVDGQKVEWSFEASPQGDPIQVTYSGTLSDDGTISGKCQYGSLGSGTFKAARKKTAQARYSNRKLTSMVAETATGLPSFMPGRNRHF